MNYPLCISQLSEMPTSTSGCTVGQELEGMVRI